MSAARNSSCTRANGTAGSSTFIRLTSPVRIMLAMRRSASDAPMVLPIRTLPCASLRPHDAQGGGNAGRSARRRSGDRSDDGGARTIRHADPRRHGRRCDQGGSAGRRQLPLDRAAPQRGHGQLLRHAQPQQAQRGAGPEAPRRARCAAAPGRWRRRVRAQHASRRRGTARARLCRAVGAQSASGLCLRLRFPQGQQQAGTSRVRRPDPGHERHGGAERRPRRRAALRAECGRWTS